MLSRKSFYDAKMILLDRSNGKLRAVRGRSKSPELRKAMAPTISVASTRVPTIFSRTFVFFSIICDILLGQFARGDYTIRTWSSEAKDGGFEFGSNFMSGCMSYAKRFSFRHDGRGNGHT